jgi:cobalt-precorrin 5A hydrolase
VKDQKLAVYALTAPGAKLAEKIAKTLSAVLLLPSRLAPLHTGCVGFERLGPCLRETFRQFSGHVLVAATGLVVRLVGPLATDKSSDPAVVCLGQDGRFVISLLSGHLGGANELARTVAAVTGGQAVINTATDLSGVPALEQLAEELGLKADSLAPVAALSRSLCESQAIGVYDPDMFLWPHLALWPENFFKLTSPPTDSLPSVCVDYRLQKLPDEAFSLRPPALAMGLGCHRGLDAEDLERLALKTLEENSLTLASVKLVATIDSRGLPGEAPAALAKRWEKQLLIYSRKELSEISVPTPSQTVMKNIGVASVCEAAAVLAARKGPLLVHKRKAPGATCAVAKIDWTS